MLYYIDEVSTKNERMYNMKKRLEIFNKVIDILIVFIFVYTAGIVIESQVLSYLCICVGSLCILTLCKDLNKIIKKYKNEGEDNE
jgi:hypothetical protein